MAFVIEEEKRVRINVGDVIWRHANTEHRHGAGQQDLHDSPSSITLNNVKGLLLFLKL